MVKAPIQPPKTTKPPTRRTSSSNSARSPAAAKETRPHSPVRARCCKNNELNSPTYKRIEGRVPVWGSEFTTKGAP
jgi:hypothetical protein